MIMISEPGESFEEYRSLLTTTAGGSRPITLYA